MSKPILIVGGGPAGLAAAHSLARVGQSSVLVEKADRLGGAPILSGYAKLVPTGEWAKDAIGGMVDRVINDPLIEVHTRARRWPVLGRPGRVLGAGLRRAPASMRRPRSSAPASPTSTR
jgi:heterodisulfide reductase subunit A